MSNKAKFFDCADFCGHTTVPKQLAQVLEYQDRFEQLVATVTTSFINITTTNIDQVITQALSELGQFVEVDRSYVALFSAEGTAVINIHEWCAEGMPSSIAVRQEVLASSYAWLMEQMEKADGIYISRMADLPSAFGKEKKWLQRQGIQSIIKIPMVYGGRLLGVVGFDSRKQAQIYSQRQFAPLMSISQILISAIERNNAEVARQSSEIQDKAILDALPDSMFKVSRSGIILGFKPSKYYPLFLPSKEIVGQHISAILPSHRVKAATDAIVTTLDAGEIQLFEYDLAQDYKTMYFEARVTKAGEEDVLVIVRDISERCRSEACDLSLLDIAVKAQEERSLEEIISLASERMMAIFGVRLLWVGSKEPDGSVKLSSVGGQTAQYLEGITLRFDNSPEGNGITGTAIRTGKFQLMDIDDPRLRPWRERLNAYSVTIGASFPLKVSGRILGALTLFVDDQEFWTKRTIAHFTNFAEQVASAIHVSTNRQSLKLLTAGLEFAANAIVITNRKRKIQWVNPALLQLTGYSAAEAMNSNIRIFGWGQHSQSFYKAMWRYITTGRIWHGEIINRRKDGSQYTAEVTITPVRDEGGKITHFISIIQDITQRKQAESEMLEAREAVVRAERLSALGVMAAGIAHEINQPLNSLKVMADGMLYWYKQGKVPEISRAMETIQEISKEADRIDLIIKHMRSFIHNSECTLPVPCDLNLAVEDSLSFIGAQILAHGIEVKPNLAADLPPIMGNSTQLEQIIINLLVNAMQSLDTVEKSGKQINIVTGWKKGQVFLTVSDNGPGISKEIKKKIFDPFFTTKPVGEGMGLGLSIIYSIITSYGGQIKVKDNKIAGGVTFQIEFPVETAKQKGERLV